MFEGEYGPELSRLPSSNTTGDTEMDGPCSRGLALGVRPNEEPRAYGGQSRRYYSESGASHELTSPRFERRPPRCHCETLRERDACYERCEPMPLPANRQEKAFIWFVCFLCCVLFTGAVLLIGKAIEYGIH